LAAGTESIVRGVAGAPRIGCDARHAPSRLEGDGANWGPSRPQPPTCTTPVSLELDHEIPAGKANGLPTAFA